jgi:hypothetical protein
MTQLTSRQEWFWLMFLGQEKETPGQTCTGAWRKDHAPQRLLTLQASPKGLSGAPDRHDLRCSSVLCYYYHQGRPYDATKLLS